MAMASVATASRSCALVILTTLLQSAFCYNAKLGLLLRIHDFDGGLLGPEWRKISASALMAVKHVNERNYALVPEGGSLLIENLHLGMDVWDTKSTPTIGVTAAVAWSSSDVDTIIGAFRSAVSGPVSLVAEISKTPVLSYGSTAASLSNKITYPSFSRVCPADSLLALAIIEICQEFRWSRIAVIYQDDSYGAGYAQDIDYFAGMNDVNVASSQKYQSGVEETIKSALQVTRDSGARVIVCITFDVDLDTIAKWAREFGLYGKGYVYITGDAISLDQNSHSPEIRDFVKGWIRLAAGPLYGEQGRKFQQVWAEEDKTALLHPVLQATEDDLQGECDDFCAFMYDAVWAAAVGISTTVAAGPGGNASVDKEVLLPNIRAATFQGATGTVKLDPATGDRSPEGLLVLIKNWVGVGGAGELHARDTWVWDQTEGLQRVVQDPPTWPGEWVTWDPPMDGTSCQPGMIYDGVLMACVTCPPGHEESGMECVKCRAGFIAPRAGMQSCEACQEGYANSSGMTHCDVCPRFSARTPNSPGKSKSECRCEANFYFRSLNESRDDCFECVECPPGAYCAGGMALPHPRAGFWAEKRCKEFGGEVECTAWNTFLECNPSRNCAGGPDLACSEGRTGRLCLDAADGWFIVGEEFWFKCGEAGHIISLAGIAAVVLCWIGIEIMAGHNHPSTATALLFVQVSTMIGTFGLRWHPYLQVVNTVFAIADFDVDFVQPYCLGDWSDVRGFYLQLLLPFIFTIAYLIFHFTKRVCKGEDWREVGARLPEAGMKKYLMFNITIYHTLCTKCFQAFRCDEFPDGLQYMTGSPTVQCWTRTHTGMLTTAVVYTLVVILGTPTLILYKIFTMQRDGTLHTAENLRLWSFVHFSYEADYKWWEVMLLLRRFVVAILAVALDSVPMMQGAITIIALTGLLAAHVFAKPYISATVDILDFCSLCGTILFVLVGLLMYPSITQEAQGVLCADFSLDDSEYNTAAGACEKEQRLKMGVAIFAIFILAVTLFTAIALAYKVVREELASKRASHIIYKGLKREHETMRRASTLASTSSAVKLSLLDTANKVALEHILNGNKLLRWAESLREKKSDPLSLRSLKDGLRPSASQFKLSTATDSYMDADQRVQALPEDVTQYSRDARANVLRALCEIPGVIEYLAWKDDQGRDGLLHFVEGMSAFAEAAQADRRPFPITDVVKFEHRPIIALMLLMNGAAGRESFQTCMDAIFESTGITACTVARGCIPTRTLSGSSDRHSSLVPDRTESVSHRGSWAQGHAEVTASLENMASFTGLSVRAENLKRSSKPSQQMFAISQMAVPGLRAKSSKVDSAQWLEAKLMRCDSSPETDSPRSRFSEAHPPPYMCNGTAYKPLATSGLQPSGGGTTTNLSDAVTDQSGESSSKSSKGNEQGPTVQAEPVAIRRDSWAERSPAAGVLGSEERTHFSGVTPGVDIEAGGGRAWEPPYAWPTQGREEEEIGYA